MRKILISLLGLASVTSLIWAQPNPEAVPAVGLIGLPVLVVGAAGYGVYRLIKKKEK